MRRKNVTVVFEHNKSRNPQMTHTRHFDREKKETSIVSNLSYLLVGKKERKKEK